MSGLYLPGMEMPTSCAFCGFCDGLADTQVGTCAFCMVDGKYRDARTNYACPLVPVPEHGRLIDADALIHSYYHAPSFPNLCKAINDAPTIIPADKEGE